MLTINAICNDLVFKDITKDSLLKVLSLYNQNELNIYATGIDRLLSLEDMNEKYLEVLVNSHEYFIGIFLADRNQKDKEQMIGVIKGRIDYENSEEAWISSIIIANEFQNQGYGKRSVNALIGVLNHIYDVRRVFIGIISANNIAKSFWQGLGFNYLRTIQQYIKLNNHQEDFIIMKKEVSI